MGKLIELAERAERATVDEQRAILEEAWTAIYPLIPLPEHSPGAYWPPQRTRFKAMLDAVAYESAAMQLVPEGWHVGRLDEDWRTGSWEARLAVRPSESQRKAFDAGRVIGNRDAGATAQTAALAICASSLRARDGGEGL